MIQEAEVDFIIFRPEFLNKPLINPKSDEKHEELCERLKKPSSSNHTVID